MEQATDKQTQFRALVEQRNSVLKEAESLARKESLSGEEVDKLGSLTDTLRNMNEDIKRRENESQGRFSKVDPDFVHEASNGKHKYSLTRAIRRVLEGKSLDGLEGEAHEELVRGQGQPKRQGGILVPFNQGMQTRANLTTTTGVGALSTVTTSNFIDILRNGSLLSKVKVSTLERLQGTIRIPRMTASASVNWLTEGASCPASSQSLDYVQLQPNQVSANVTYTRNFLLQTSLDTNDFVTKDLALSTARDVDRVILNGIGSGAEPAGLLNAASGVPVNAIGVNGGPFTWTNVVGLETTVNAANGVVDETGLAYVSSAKGMNMLKTLTKAGATYPVFIMEDAGGKKTLNSQPFIMTNSVPSTLSKGTSTGNLTALVFGDWSQVMFATWGNAYEVICDPYTFADAGSVRLVSYLDCDVKLRHAASFAVINDGATS